MRVKVGHQPVSRYFEKDMVTDVLVSMVLMMAWLLSGVGVAVSDGRSCSGKS